MSAPNTDVEKQKKQHKGPLAGMRAVVIWALGLLVILILYLFLTGGGADEQGTAIEAPAAMQEGAEGSGTTAQ